MSYGPCDWCHENPGVRLDAMDKPICRPFLIDLAEQDREEDEPLGEWDEDAYLDAVYGED